MFSAAQEAMLAPSMVWSEEEIFSLAALSAVALETHVSANAVKGEKPHQGVARQNRAPHLGQAVCNSTTALGVSWSWWSGTASGAGVSYDYDAFGNLINSTGSTPNNYLFAGEQYDPALGLYYNRARYLNTTTGRFWGMDTVEGSAVAPLSMHKYLYASANPPNRIDPSGHEDLASISMAEGISEELDAEQSEADFAAKKVLSLHVVDIYSCSRLQAYIIPIHCWVYANEPGNEGVRYDIGAEEEDRGPGLIVGSVRGFLQITPTTLSKVQADANLSFTKQASLSQLGFLRWQAVVVAEFEFLEFTDEAITYSTNYSFNTLTNDAVNCITFTGAAIAAAKQIEATDH